MSIILLLTVCLFATSHTSRTYTMVENKATVAGKPDWKAKTKGYEDCIFYFGKNPGMQKTFVATDIALKDYIGIKLSTNTLASMVNNQLTVEDMEPPRDFANEAAMDLEFNNSMLAKRDWEDDRKAYNAEKKTVRQNMGKAATILWSHCHVTLRTKIQADKDYQNNPKVMSDAGELYRIICKIMNGSNSVQNPTESALEASYNLYYVKGQDHESLAQYAEAFHHLVNVAERAGWSFASDKLRDNVLNEMAARNDTTSVRSKLMAWKTASEMKTLEGNGIITLGWWETRNKNIEDGKKALHELMLAAIFLKRSGPVYTALRDEKRNDYAKGVNNTIASPGEQFTQMEYWKPAYKMETQAATEKTKTEKRQTHGDQHYQGKGKQLGDCYRCDRPNCRDCTHKTKANGDPVRTEAEVQLLKNAKRRESALRFLKENPEPNEEADDGKKKTGGTGMFVGGEIVPTYAEILAAEESEDDQCPGYTFNTREITIDLRNTNHAFNQAAFNKANGGRSTTLTKYQLLNDNQSTSDIIVWEGFVINIRECTWTLVLRTQSGVCKINQIADMPGVGTVWYYPEGAANILSGHRLVVNSGWSVKQDSDRYHQTGNTDDLSIRCVTNEGVKCEFKPTADGLHVMDCESLLKTRGKNIFGSIITDNGTMNGTAMGSCNLVKAKVEALCFAEGLNKINNSEGIDTVTGSLARFAKRDQLKIQATRRFQHVSGHPSDDTMLYAAVTNTVMNSPFSKEDIMMTIEALGKSGYAVAGKTTSTRPDEVDARTALTEIPPTILNHYKNVELSIDILFVNRIPFLATISKYIHYGTIQALPNMKIPTIEEGIESVIKSYGIRGFHIATIHVDLQFKAIKDRNQLSLRTNVCSREEHVPEIERYIRVIKERARCYFAMLLRIEINTIPRGMVMQLMRTVVFYINCFVWRKGVSQVLSPITIVEGLKVDYHKHFHVIFGEYLMTYDGTTNTMTKRTTGAIAMGPSDNIQGGIRCFSLATGKILHRLSKDCTLMKMPHEVLGRIKFINKREHSVKGLIFGDRNDTEDPDNAITGLLETETHPDHVNEPADLEIDDNGSVEEETDTNNTGLQQDDDDEERPEADTNSDAGEDNDTTGLQSEHFNDTTGLQSEHFTLPEHQDDEPILAQDTVPEEDESSVEEVTTTRSGRSSRPPDRLTYGDTNLVARHEDNRCLRPYYQDENLDYHLSEGMTLTSNYFVEGVTRTELEIPTFEEKITRESEHYSLYVEALQWFGFDMVESSGMAFKTQHLNVKQGIKQFGDDGKQSAMKEIENLTSNECFGETDYDKLTQTQKDRALPILMFMIMKRNGKVKTRGVARGDLQRVYTNKDDCSSPTPDFYAFKYIIALIAKEGRDCATVDLPGFFLQTEQEENSDLMLKLTGQVAALLVESDEQKWAKHLKEENGRHVMYVKCDRAIYGTMNAALLAYKKLAKLFGEWDFVMNPYDPCVWNKPIGKHQMTIMFHIDDLLMAHMHPHIVTLFIKKLEHVYGKRDPLTITRGLVHEYLGMTFDLREKGEVILSQYDFVKKLHDDLPDEMKTGRYRYTPAPDDLFKISESSPKLDCGRKETYHHIAAKTLWLSQRSRNDIQLATGYHCSRVKDPNEDDWRKLTWLMRYVWWTRFIPTIIRITDEGATIYIDGSHAIHADSRGHSGMYTTMGKGALINMAKKLGLVTISSTETEVVATGERLPKCTWFRYFRIAQGGSTTEDILMQDNKSAILLQKNWPFSTGKGSKHINIRYFFAVDKIKNKEIKVIYCPTEEMIADFNTKPLQGKLFFYFRDKIMGIREEDFKRYKDNFVESLKQYGLYEGDDDLYDLKTTYRSQGCVGDGTTEDASLAIGD